MNRTLRHLDTETLSIECVCGGGSSGQRNRKVLWEGEGGILATAGCC